MKRAEMRIVGLNPSRGAKPVTLFVQRKVGNAWEQTVMTFAEFIEMMQADFPDFYSLCDNTMSDYERANFFYSYGEETTRETFVFS